MITDKDRVNMLLDGLAEAYDHVVIAGAYDAVRDLFVTIEGSIDAGVVVAGSEGSERNGYFLPGPTARRHAGTRRGCGILSR